jgi:hypothetical protein
VIRVTANGQLTPTPAPLAVQDAFDSHYAGLVEELTELCGSPVAAEAGVDEAFLRAASNPEEFEQIGRQREWLLVSARNHVMRKPFRRDHLDPASTSSLARFERPSLDAALDRARRAHRKHLMTTAAAAATAALMIAGAVVMTAPTVAEWQSAGASAGTRAASSDTSQKAEPSPSDTGARRAPRPSPAPTEEWPPPLQAIIGHADSRIYSIASPDTPGTRASVWTRCRRNPNPDAPWCQGENAARAVEVEDAKGRSTSHYLMEGQGVAPGFDGHFVITGWDGDFTLISSTMAEPQAFAVKRGATPRRGMAFTQCAATPCTVDARGTVNLIDLPSAESWHWNTSHGWIGHTVGGTFNSESQGPRWTVFIQQPKGSFASVEVTTSHAVSHEEVWIRAFMGPGNEAVVALDGPADNVVAISTNHGRTWQYRWALDLSETLPIEWKSWLVAQDPPFKVSSFTPVP